MFIPTNPRNIWQVLKILHKAACLSSHAPTDPLKSQHMSIKPKVPIKLQIVGQKPIDLEQIALRKFVSSTAPRPTQWSTVLPEAWIKGNITFFRRMFMHASYFCGRGTTGPPTHIGGTKSQSQQPQLKYRWGPHLSLKKFLMLDVPLTCHECCCWQRYYIAAMWCNVNPRKRRN